MNSPGHPQTQNARMLPVAALVYRLLSYQDFYSRASCGVLKNNAECAWLRFLWRIAARQERDLARVLSIGFEFPHQAIEGLAVGVVVHPVAEVWDEVLTDFACRILAYLPSDCSLRGLFQQGLRHGGHGQASPPPGSAASA